MKPRKVKFSIVSQQVVELAVRALAGAGSDGQ
jgi:hypothetical protein